MKRLLRFSHDIFSSIYANDLPVCLCLTSLQQQGHLKTAPHLLSLAKDLKLGKCKRAVAWQSITLPLRHASST